MKPRPASFVIPAHRSGAKQAKHPRPGIKKSFFGAVFSKKEPLAFSFPQPPV
jgi:hypothetical protein